MSIYPVSSSDWAAWVQAFGSIGAIVAAAWIAIWQSKKTVRQIYQQKMEQEQERGDVFKEIVGYAVYLQSSITDRISDEAELIKIFIQPSTIEKSSGSTQL